MATNTIEDVIVRDAGCTQRGCPVVITVLGADPLVHVWHGDLLREFEEDQLVAEQITAWLREQHEPVGVSCPISDVVVADDHWTEDVYRRDQGQT